jgi:hypothetical protein
MVFLLSFTMFFGEVIKVDLMAMFYDFHNGDLDLFSLNFDIVTPIMRKRKVRFV